MAIPVENYKQWYEEAMVASNEAGYACMSAAQTIRALDAERDQLAGLLNEMTDAAKQLKDHKAALEISLEGTRAALEGHRKLVAEQAAEIEKLRADWASMPTP